MKFYVIDDQSAFEGADYDHKDITEDKEQVREFIARGWDACSISASTANHLAAEFGQQQLLPAEDMRGEIVLEPGDQALVITGPNALRNLDTERGKGKAARPIETHEPLWVYELLCRRPAE